MAHGSKKWIVAFDGKVKRSNDRTKKDYYRGLKNWDEYDYAFEGSRFAWRRQETHENFCPQCKHVQKHIRDIKAENKVEEDRARERYYREFGDAAKQWEAHHRSHYIWTGGDLLGGLKKLVPAPKVPEPPSFYTWMWKIGRYDVPGHHTFDTRSYLCYKHENWYEAKWKMWTENLPGKNDRYQWTRRQEYRNYRNDTKILMQKAKYDDEYYDRISNKKKNGWLD